MKPSLVLPAALAAGLRRFAPWAPLLLAGTGCAEPAFASSPRLAFTSQARPAAACRITGDAQTIATHVVPDELQLRARPRGGFAVAILDAVDPCLTVAVAPDGHPLGDHLEPCPAATRPGQTLATNGVETYAAHETWDGAGSRHLTVGYKTYDWPYSLFGIAHAGRETVVERPLLPAPGELETEQTEPKVALAAGETFLLVWIEDDAVRAQPLFRAAETAGTPLRVSPPDAIEAEHPAVAFASTQQGVADGLVVYAARTPAGFNVLATPVTCSSM